MDPLPKIFKSNINLENQILSFLNTIHIDQKTTTPKMSSILLFIRTFWLLYPKVWIKFTLDDNEKYIIMMSWIKLWAEIWNRFSINFKQVWVQKFPIFYKLHYHQKRFHPIDFLINREILEIYFFEAWFAKRILIKYIKGYR